MLFKTLIQQYGSFLSGSFQPNNDPIGHIVPGADTEAFRRKVIDDLGASTVYVLDTEAADYLDSFREDVMGGEFSDAANAKVSAFLSEVDVPPDLIWLEYDHAALFGRRLERGHVVDEEIAAKVDFGPRGFLIDNRAPDHLTITLFRLVDKKVVDPMIHLHFDKEIGGRTEFKQCRFFEHKHMGIFYAHAGHSQDEFEGLVSQEFADTTYDGVLAFMLFAVLSSKDDGIRAEPRDSLTSKERRTARKFGKTWITDKVRDHIVIHIGEPGRRHLAERTARKAHERAPVGDRASPVEHWVAEHERHYKDGKIVVIQSHKRGSRVGPSVPRLVKGPVEKTS